MYFCLPRLRSSHWGCFIQHVQVLAANSSALRNSKNITPDALLQLTSDKRIVLSRECKTSLQRQFHAVIAGSLVSSACQCHGTSQSALWLPFDLFLEDTMDGSQVTATSAVEVLTGTIHSCTSILELTLWEKSIYYSSLFKLYH